MHVKTYNKRKSMIEESDQVKIKLPEEKQPHPLHPEAPAAWGLGLGSATFLRRLKMKKTSSSVGKKL